MDRPAALSRCLRGLLSGAMLPDEVIVVNQGSKGVEADVQVAFAHCGTALRHVVMNARGVSRGRNRGTSLAAHDIIVFTDDDCVPHRDWLASLYAGLDSAAAGVTGRVLPLPSDVLDAVAVSSRISEKPCRYDGLGRSVPWDVGTGGNLLLRRDVLECLNGFDEALGPGAPGRAAEDIDLIYRVLTSGFTLVYEPKAIVFHEMKTRMERRKTRYPYAFGMGSFLGTHVVTGDRRALILLARFVFIQVYRLGRAIRRRATGEIVESLLALMGVWVGVVGAAKEQSLMRHHGPPSYMR